MSKCLVTFTAKGGTPRGRQDALNVLEQGKQYEVVGGSEGQSYTYLILKGVEGRWNSVLFEGDLSEAPLARLGLPGRVAAGCYEAPVSRPPDVAVAAMIKRGRELGEKLASGSVRVHALKYELAALEQRNLDVLGEICMLADYLDEVCPRPPGPAWGTEFGLGEEESHGG